MKSYTWIYNDTISVRFTTHQAMIIDATNPLHHRVKFPQPNEEHLGLYNAKLTADRMRELCYDFDGRVVAGIKAMRENVPFPAVLSEIKARRESDLAPRTINGYYIIQIPLAQDYQRVVEYMNSVNIKWF